MRDKAAAALGAERLLARDNARVAAALERDPEEPASPWETADGFQLSGARTTALPIVVDGEAMTAEVAYGSDGTSVTVGGEQPANGATVIDAGDGVVVLHQGRQTRVTLRDLAHGEAGYSEAGGLVRAPMHGKVLAVFVEKGAQVTRGQRLAIIEAMKMEHTLTAPIDGVVVEIAVAKDAQVAEDAKVMVIEPASESH